MNANTPINRFSRAIIVCAWCSQIIGTKASVSPEATHTICPACLRRCFPTAQEEPQ